MSLHAALQYLLFILVMTALVRPLGGYLERVFSGKPTWLDPLCRPLERLLYRMCRVNASREMTAAEYSVAFLLFGFTGMLLLYALLRLQRWLPFFFPQYQTTPVTPDLAWNTATSFATTTTWQAYGGETTMSYVAQMAGLAAQNFLAGAAGLAAGIAFIRGFVREKSETLGNFWVDMTRALLWVLLPASILVSLLLVSQGVPMNWSGYGVAHTLEHGSQVIAQGPVAALESIKNLGTNGGGFFNANGAHPFENPTPLANLIEMLSIAVLPAALTNTFGRMVRQPRQGWLLFSVMLGLLVLGFWVCGRAEAAGNPLIQNLNQVAGNMEGKEVRFGTAGTALTAVVTSNLATGSTNAMHDSFTPIGGLVPLVNLILGEVIFGGLGTGIYSIILVALIAVFLTGLMIGRTPEYLGKRLGPTEQKLIMLYTLAGHTVVLALAAVAVATRAGLAGLTTNTGAHGLTEILYAYASCVANNGQSFAGLNANTQFYNVTTVVAMLVGRFALAIPALALAGQFASQGRAAAHVGTLRTDTATFGVVLAVSVCLVGGLCYFPALSLGPLLERALFWH
jgi:K+-transporting ATPase ATPase A chain